MMIFTHLVNRGFDPCKPIGVMMQGITPDSDGELVLMAAEFGYFVKDIPTDKKATNPIDDYDPTYDLCLRLVPTEANKCSVHRLPDEGDLIACKNNTWFGFQGPHSVTVFSQETHFLAKVTQAMAELEGVQSVQ